VVQVHPVIICRIFNREHFHQVRYSF
jgi:hypothetical protein